MLAHQSDDGRLVQAKLPRNGVKRRPVFPCHLDHAVKGGEIDLWRFQKMCPMSARPSSRKAKTPATF